MDNGERLKLGLGGAFGRMGRAVISVVDEREDVELAVVFGRPEAAGDSAIPPSLDGAHASCQAIIDFSTAKASADLARAAAERGGPALVIGATGFTDEDEAAIVAASQRIAIVKSANFSLGLNVLAGLVEQAAARLGPEEWDVEIVEAHHRRKVDAPSGAALMLGAAAARGRDVRLDEMALRGRDGLVGPRPQGGIGFAVVRAGGLVGEHSVILGAEDEIVALSHSARDRRVFARGAVEAAAWVVGKPAGLYDMRDVLGFRV